MTRSHTCAGKATAYLTYNLRRPVRVAHERPCNARPRKGSAYCWRHQNQDPANQTATTTDRSTR